MTDRRRHRWRWLAITALVLSALVPGARAHEIPGDVTIRMLVRPDAGQLRILVRAPLEAMRDITFPLVGQGFLDVPQSGSALRDAAEIWLASNIEAYENDEPLALRIVGVRASIPSDRSFDSFDTARAHLRGTPLPAGTPRPRRHGFFSPSTRRAVRRAFSIGAPSGSRRATSIARPASSSISSPVPRAPAGTRSRIDRRTKPGASK